MQPVFGSLEYAWDTANRRMRWFLSAPGYCFDHLPLASDRAESLDLLREVNAVRVRDGLGNIYVRGI